MFNGLVWDVGVCVFSDYDEDGYPRIQWDAYGDTDFDGDAVGVPAQYQHHTFGFFSKPKDPSVDAKGIPLQGEACNVGFCRDGDDVHTFVWDDPRCTQKLPALKQGGSVQYAFTDEKKVSYHVIDGKDGDQIIHVPVDDKLLVLHVGFDGGGKPTVEITHSDGQSLIMFDKKVLLTSPNGSNYIQISDDGIVLNGNVTTTGAIVSDPQNAKQLATIDDLKAAVYGAMNALVLASSGILAAAAPPEVPMIPPPGLPIGTPGVPVASSTQLALLFPFLGTKNTLGS